MVRIACKSLVFAIVLLSLPALAQDSAAAVAGLSGCGDPKLKFEVKPSSWKNPAQPEQGKALVYFIEEDINTNFVTHTSRADIDGKSIGATHGHSYFYFSVDPGVHHICATTQFGVSSEENLTAVAHFTAEAGGVYYFEIKNLSWSQPGAHDASLFPLDSDEGKFLTSSLPLVSSHQKK